MPQPMTPDEFESVFRIMVDTWPSLKRFQRTRTDDRAGWYRDLRHVTRDDFTRGVHHLRRTFKAKEPSLAHLLDAIAERRAANQQPVARRPACGECEHGWEIIDRTGQWTVRPCRNGCDPRQAA